MPDRHDHRSGPCFYAHYTYELLWFAGQSFQSTLWTRILKQADLLEGVDEPVQEDLHAKQHEQRPEEEVGQVVDDRDG